MPRKPDTAMVLSQVESKIYLIRGQRVMLDSDLAELYEVPTKRLNEQVQRNIDRFPADFSFLLTEEEFTNLRSQIATSNEGRGGRRHPPRVFTEHGVTMLAGVLNSPKAVQVNIEIVRAFIRLRRLLAAPGELVEQLQKLAETVKLHDEKLKVLTDVIQKMLEPPPEPPRGRFGFHPPEPSAKARTKLHA